MRLQDIADHTGLALSTVSRVCNEKYAQTKWGIFKLREFFTEGITTDDGMVLAASEIKSVIKELIDNEDKHKPLSDQKLESMLKERGKPVARRTIAKYREQMGIPVARLRKE
jgi:RNA polymerase sigma-54 factor